MRSDEGPIKVVGWGRYAWPGERARRREKEMIRMTEMRSVGVEEPSATNKLTTASNNTSAVPESPDWENTIAATVAADRGLGQILEEETGPVTDDDSWIDVYYDLVAIQYHSLKAGHEYGQYIRDAKNA